MSFAIEAVCGCCRHAFRHRTTDEEYKVLVKNLELSIRCPRSGCRAEALYSMTRDLKDSDWTIPQAPSSPGARSLRDTGSPQSASRQGAVARQSDPVSASSAGKPEIDIEAPISPTFSDPPFAPQMAPVSQDPPMSAGNRSQPVFSPYSRPEDDGLIDRLQGKFRKLPEPLQYTIILVLTLIVIAAILSDPGRKDRGSDPVITAEQATDTAEQAEGTEEQAEDTAEQAE